jgi:hypothetical protein
MIDEEQQAELDDKAVDELYEQLDGLFNGKPVAVVTYACAMVVAHMAVENACSEHRGEYIKAFIQAVVLEMTAYQKELTEDTEVSGNA